MGKWPLWTCTVSTGFHNYGLTCSCGDFGLMWSEKHVGITWKVLKGSTNAPASTLASECERAWHKLRKRARV